MSSAVVSDYSIPVSESVERVAEKSRMVWIDMARGITILMVVIGHSGMGNAMQHLLQPTRMPLLFLTAGFVFNFERHRDNMLGYLTSRTVQLMRPYFFTAALFMIGLMALSQFGINLVSINPLKDLGAVLLATGYARTPDIATVGFDSPIWFLGCLAAATALFVGMLCIFRDAKSYRTMVVVSLLLAAAGRLIGFFALLPWSFDVAMVAQFFMVVGFMLRRHGVQFANDKLFLVLLIAYCAVSLTGISLNMVQRQYPNFAVFCAAGIGGSYLVFYAARKFYELVNEGPLGRYLVDPWVFLGKNTLVIMSFHWAGLYVREILNSYVIHRDSNTFSDYGLGLFCCMAVSLLAIVVLKRFEPLRKIYYK